jgi:alanine-glyoxylate transaminase/serine-glyoxylate transaminase/serine-pyruvate transaminase
LPPNGLHNGPSALGGFLHGDTPRLMIPGPGELDDRDLILAGRQPCAHYGPRWARLHEQLLQNLSALLGAPHIYVIPGSGTASLDAALFNLFEPGQRVVVLDTGYFGRRLLAMAAAHGLRAEALPVAPDAPADPDAVARAARGRVGVLMVHVETSTGVRHPVAEIARAAREVGACCLVDAIASVGGELLDVEAMGLAGAVTASQKGLGAPPGLGIVALSAEGWERTRARSRRPPSWYFDLRNWEAARVESPDWEPHPVTMPSSLVLPLASRVETLLADDLAAVVARRTRLAQVCRAGLQALELRPVTDAQHQASLVVVARTDGPPDDLVQRVLASSGIQVTTGLAPVPDAIRIGLVGRNAGLPMVSRLLESLRAALGEPNRPDGENLRVASRRSTTCAFRGP